MIYIIILINKIIENMLSTLRIIVIAKNNKILGAVLNILISIIWICSTSIVIHNLNKDYLKIIFFALGSGIGSYLGSFIEEKIK